MSAVNAPTPESPASAPQGPPPEAEAGAGEAFAREAAVTQVVDLTPEAAVTQEVDLTPEAAADQDAARDVAGARARRRFRILPHLPIIALVTIGAALRTLYVIAYAPAFWFHGDSGSYIQMATTNLAPRSNRPVGYPVVLRAVEFTHTHTTIVIVQHLLSLLLVVAVYSVLRRRGLRRWLCCVAVVPLVFDSLTLTMGQYLLPDMLFSVLLAAAVVLLLWSPVPGYPAALVSGLLVAGAWIIKPSALPIVPLFGLYLLVRRAGWRRVVGFALAFVLPYVAMLAWIGDRQSVYGSQSTTALYGRTAIIADCNRLKLTPDERLACPDQPLGQRWDRADAFFWRRPARLGMSVYTPEGGQRLTDFAIEVLKQQPLDYLRIVVKESAAHFVPELYLGPDNECLRERLVPPVEFRGAGKVPDRCPPAQAGPGFTVDPAVLETAPEATPLTEALHRYGQWLRIVPVVMSIAVLLGLAALVAGRRVDGRIRLDVAMLLLAGPGLTVLTVAVGMYEPRYALPALPMSVIAAALAWHGLTHRRHAPGQPTGPPDPADQAS